MIKKYNITVAKKYFKDGVEKTLWQNCGTMTEFIKETGEISRKIEIPAISLDAQVFPFEDKKSTGYSKPTQTPVQKPVREMTPEEEYNAIPPTDEGEVVNAEDIPY
jgi:hypothetical protein